MRTLLVCREFPGFAESGGIGTYSGIVARELAGHGVDVHVLCVGDRQPRASHQQDGFVVHTAPYQQVKGFGRPLGLPRLGFWASQAYSVWREFRRLRLDVDVVEAPELYAEAGGIAHFAPHTPLVVRLHSGFAVLAVPPHDHGPDYRATVWFENLAVRRADVVVSTAPHMRAVREDLALDAARTREIIYPVAERPIAAPNMSSMVLFVGRLERRKRPELLIEAAPRVLEMIPHARFVFLGADTVDPAYGSYRRYLERLADERAIRGAIDFRPPVPQEQVQSVMAEAGVCVFPSRWESFGLVVAEAGAIARPVVVSDIPAFRDFVTDGASGDIVRSADARSWADAVIRALSDRQRSLEMARRLRSDLRDRAAPPVVAEQILESYTAAIAHRRRHRS